jgi:hypothetical protein
LGKHDAEWFERYLEGFYWALATIMLIGSKGDTLIETAYCIVSLLSTIGVFAVILSQVGNVLDEIGK